jgi:hypothetical protein
METPNFSGENLGRNRKEKKVFRIECLTKN